MELVFTDNIYQSATEYAQAYPCSRQLIFFEEFGDMKDFAKLNSLTMNFGTCERIFGNGSIIEIGYASDDEHIGCYSAAEFDCVYITKPIGRYKYERLLQRMLRPREFSKRWCIYKASDSFETGLFNEIMKASTWKIEQEGETKC